MLYSLSDVAPWPELINMFIYANEILCFSADMLMNCPEGCAEYPCVILHTSGWCCVLSPWGCFFVCSHHRCRLTCLCFVLLLFHGCWFSLQNKLYFSHCAKALKPKVTSPKPVLSNERGLDRVWCLWGGGKPTFQLLLEIAVCRFWGESFANLESEVARSNGIDQIGSDWNEAAIPAHVTRCEKHGRNLPARHFTEITI